MQRNDIKKSTFLQLFNPIINEKFLNLLSDMEVEIKK